MAEAQYPALAFQDAGRLCPADRRPGLVAEGGAEKLDRRV
jgi:hypothetical protein